MQATRYTTSSNKFLIETVFALQAFKSKKTNVPTTLSLTWQKVQCKDRSTRNWQAYGFLFANIKPPRDIFVEFISYLSCSKFFSGKPVPKL